MAKKPMSPPSPLDIANLMGSAAHKKAQKPQVDSDGDNDGDESPASPQSKKVAAMKEQEKAKGKQPPKQFPKKGI